MKKIATLLIVAVLTTVQPALSRNLFDLILGRHNTQIVEDTPSSDKKSKTVSAEILVNAPAKVVFETVHLERDCAPNLVSNDLLQSDGNHSVFKQQWQLVPFLAKTVCVMDEQDTPDARIDFKLLRSDVFKRMDGAWQFIPMDDGRSTKLTLSVRFQIRGPGANFFVVGFARKKLNQRLEHIKELAEETHAKLDVNAKVAN